eukprot:GILI01006780.1.p1 GENE.GILI01006780.1~~GILI01006780.1.p1  ORF type:complete len:510 (-),score=132.84 GILI01006780.1:113-1642(-)
MPGRHGKQRMKKRKTRRERPTEMEVTLKDSIHNRIRKEKAILAPMIPPTVPRYTAKIPTNTAALILASAGSNAIGATKNSTAQLLMPTFAAATTIRTNANNAKRPASTATVNAPPATPAALTAIVSAPPKAAPVAAPETPTSPVAASPKGRRSKRVRDEEDATTPEPAEKARQVEGTPKIEALVAPPTPSITPMTPALGETDNADTPRKRNSRKKEPSVPSGPVIAPIVIPSAAAASPKRAASQPSAATAAKKEGSVSATPIAVIPKSDLADASPVPAAATEAASPSATTAEKKTRRSKGASISVTPTAAAAPLSPTDNATIALFTAADTADATKNTRSTGLAHQGLGNASPRPSIKASSIGSFQSTTSEAAASPDNNVQVRKARSKKSVSVASTVESVSPQAPTASAVEQPLRAASALSSVKSFLSNVSSKLFSPTASSSAKATPIPAVAAAAAAVTPSGKKRGANSGSKSASPSGVHSVLSPTNARKAATPSAKVAASPATDKPRWK